jgi:hypothetical protein
MPLGRINNCIALLVLFFSGSTVSIAQRTYSPKSILAEGSWYKIAVHETGVYKIDLNILNSLGISASSLPSASIRVFGNGGGMLPESAGERPPDDITEIPVWVNDGGDGSLNGSDHLVFFAEGPNQWIANAGSNWHHQKNLYSDSSYYFITVGGTGKTIAEAPVITGATIEINSSRERLFYELDTFNFLSSGRQWFGEEFANAPGKTQSRNFNLELAGLIATQQLSLKTNCVSRSFGAPGFFSIRVNGNPIIQLEIPEVATGPYDQFARMDSATAVFEVSSTAVDLSFDYNPGSANAQGWLDWFELFYERQLSMASVDQLAFRNWTVTGTGNRAAYNITDASSDVQVWRVTNPLEPRRMIAGQTNNSTRFIDNADELQEYVAFRSANLPVPTPIGRVLNQNLHDAVFADYIIVSHESLLSEAKRLAAFHQQSNNLTPIVVSTEQVFNEFSSGKKDPTAIRDFVKMFYDRAGSDTARRPKYLLLFGDASFDYKARIHNNTNLVPCYESRVSLDPLSTHTSDDYFGFLDDADNINDSDIDLLDIGIGRIPAMNLREAKAIVDKIIAYSQPKSLGPWRNELSFVADDEDANLHLQDAEAVINNAQKVGEAFNFEKIYLDAYIQQSAAGGSRYPDANLTINNKIFNGTLLWNYNGHGSYRRLAEEVVLDQDVINSFKNADRLPLFVTATCDVAPFDNPLVASIGENLLLREKTGAIALMTTTRLVFAFSNREMNNNYMQVALKRKADGKYPSLGEAVRLAKNITYQFSGDVINNRKFTLLGDPALTIAYPLYNINTTAINGKAVTSVPDTLKALSRYSIEGVVADNDGNMLADFNGTIHASVFDKAQALSTRGNDPGSVQTSFQAYKSLIYKGKAKVNGGKFKFDFIVPKDINYAPGNGRISYYAENGSTDGNGVFGDFVVGGSGDSINDKEGPEIRAFLNDERFINGSITNENPVLLVKLTDSSGINIMGSGIGHDLVAILDNDPSKQYVLNEFYEADLDDYKRGVVRFQLPVLEEGTHTLTIKAWDIANNSNQAFLDFRIIKAQDLTINHVLNYPNPFTTSTSFWFEHNRPGEELRVSVQIYTVTGKLVKTLRSTIISTGNRSNEVEWDGRDEYGNRIGRGVYIYNLKVKTPDGKTAQKLEKLYLL